MQLQFMDSGEDYWHSCAVVTMWKPFEMSPLHTESKDTHSSVRGRRNTGSVYTKYMGR